MRRLMIAGFVVLGVLVSGANGLRAGIETEVDLKLAGEGRSLNERSRLNPDNNLLGLGHGAGTVEARFTVSRHFDREESARWLFKGYSFYSSDTEPQGRRNDQARVDELFADWKSGNWFLSAGKRRVNWGTALAFNPVNVIVPPRDPLNPKLETEGQPMAWASYNRGGVTADVILTRNFDREWNSDLNRWGARLGAVAGNWDVSGYYFDGQDYRAQTGGVGKDAVPATARPRLWPVPGDAPLRGRGYERMLGMSVSGNLLPGVTLYSEAAAFSHNHRKYYDGSGPGKLKDQATVQAVVGSYVALSPQSFLSFFRGDANLTLEAYYNGGGYSPSERRDYFEALDRALGERDPAVLTDYQFTGMNRRYFLATYRNSFKERFTAELTGLVSLDRSFSMQTQVQYNLSDYYAARAKLIRNHGGRQTEFGNAPLSTVLEISLDISF